MTLAIVETLIEYPDGNAVRVPSEESDSLNALRVVVDGVFLSMNEFMQSFGTYRGINSGEGGVAKHLRSRLFEPVKAGRRGTKQTEIGKDASQVQIAGDGRTISSNHSKAIKRRKEICESKLLSLLYSVVYNSTAMKCRLLEKHLLAKQQAKGKEAPRRGLSSLPGARLFLKGIMYSILSDHGNAVEVLYNVLPPVFSVLPQMFFLVSRTFFGILSITSAQDREKSEKVKPERAFETLKASLIEIKTFIDIWARRNFMPFTELKHYQQANFNEGCYKAVRDLLQAMVVVLPPAGDEGSNPTFRKGASFDFALDRSNTNRTEPGKSIAVGERSPRSGAIEVVQSDVNACHAFIDALTRCTSMVTKVKPSQLKEFLDAENCPPEIWLSCRNTGYLTRLTDLSEFELQFRKTMGAENSRDFTALFVRQVRGDIAQCWTALGMSNSRSVKYLSSLEIASTKEAAEATTELIFGVGIAAMTIYERKKDITEICSMLQSEKGPLVVRTDSLREEEENEVESLHGTEIEEAVRTEEQTDANAEKRNVEPTSGVEHGVSLIEDAEGEDFENDGRRDRQGTEESLHGSRPAGGKRRFRETSSPPGYEVQQLD